MILGIGELLIARLGEKTRDLIPAGNVSGQFMTPAQGYIVGIVFLIAASYAIGRAFIGYKNDH